MARLARKINGEWDFSSTVGEGMGGGLVCHTCGEIVKQTYRQLAYGERYGVASYCFCPQCFSGDKETALTCRVGT